MTGPERFHRRFLCREPSGKMRYGVSVPRTIGDLSRGEHTAQKALAISFEGRADPGNVRRIDSKSEDVHGSAPA
jgi:hypothetical protein